MKKFLINLFLLLFFLGASTIIILSTIGIKTSKFNNIISNKVSQTKKIDLKLEVVKFKIDLKKLSLFIETKDPKITYNNLSIPVTSIKAYIDFFSLLKSKPVLKKITLRLNELDIAQLNKLSALIKPSNFKTLINNKIKNGKLVSEIEIFLDNQGIFKNFIAKGTVKSLEANLLKDLYLKNMNLSFFADKNDILIKNIYGEIEDIDISNGDIKLNFENGLKLESFFESQINLDEKKLNKYNKILENFNFAKNINLIKGNLKNNLNINLDNTYKVTKYNFNIQGRIEKINLKLLIPIKNSLIREDINEINFSDFQIKTSFAPKSINLNGEGKYSINNSIPSKISFDNNYKNNTINAKLDLKYKKDFYLNFLNYKKSNDTIADVSLDFQKKLDVLKINYLKFTEEKNFIKLNDVVLKGDKLLNFKKIEVFTSNNDFIIQKGKKILIDGKKFDATNLSKYFANQSKENKFKVINNDIEINFKNIIIPLSEKLQNFKLIGKIKNGNFIKISSKGSFGGDNFLDISMKKDKKSNKKYLEIYSDLTRPLLTEYSFFKGLSGGKLLFTSIIDGSQSNSNLKIENFKIINAPGIIKLLSLADLGGLADLAEGEGLSFDVLEIDMEKNNNSLKLNEILALGPSMSVLMEGYQDESGMISLRGTLVPAKTLNKLISKIPVIGKIVIPKEIGEGLFGVSFKMKGPKGKVKTTINPIRTLTPRFIQKIIDRNKNSK